ncbi:hypothetical protein [Ignatzschineria cameli]|uniref:hypothetical protein n=1 Tax=Ignatzschineria cameli TaxID=2182793 RepID=UPI0013007DA2|nr:hypothetical protein [Ignatzschineria cameli]
MTIASLQNLHAGKYRYFSDIILVLKVPNSGHAEVKRTKWSVPAAPRIFLRIIHEKIG